MTSSATPTVSSTRSRRDGFSPREVRDQLELVRAHLLRVKDVAKVDFIGTQDEKIYLEFSTQQMAALGIDAASLMDALQAQNAIVPSGVLEEGQERIAVRVSGSFDSEESLRAVNFQAGNRFYRLSDIADDQARLRRSASADVPLQRAAGDRARDIHVAGRRRARAWPRDRRKDGRDHA